MNKAKQRNPRFGCPRIAQQISLAFGIEINKDVVRRVLAKHYRPAPGDNGPSWLTTIGHAKDNLWSIDLFHCESIVLKSHWVMVVMDQFSRKIIGFATHPGNIDGPCLCRMFNKIQYPNNRSPNVLRITNEVFPMARTSSITLGEMQGFVDYMLSTGRYSSASEVIRDSLRLLQEKEARSSLEQLRQAIIEGEESGVVPDHEATPEALFAKAQQEARRRGFKV